uniref:S1/P1 nuclease n=1 Tax=Alistipes sp. TaxID=1872444 RepID=UPI0040572C94
MKRLLLAALLLLGGVVPVFGWGQKGHDVVAYVAECHLTPRTARAIDRLLEGHSLVYWSNWMDNASHTPAYGYTKTWHYVNIDEGKTLETMEREPQGDLLTALECILSGLESHTLSHQEEALYLKMLIHLVGDLHCPMHTGHRSDLGGNRWPIRYFGRESNLHTVWDSSLVESAHKWGYTEWQHECDRLSRKEAKSICEGNPYTWMVETAELCQEIYATTPKGSNLSYDYVARYSPLIERQLVRGGHRLAHLLNKIYG